MIVSIRLSCPKLSPSVYKPRRPQKTVFYQVVKKSYKTWVKNLKVMVRRSPSLFIESFKGFIKCGVLAPAFACAHCNACNHEFLVGFYCKLRIRPGYSLKLNAYATSRFQESNDKSRAVQRCYASAYFVASQAIFDYDYAFWRI